MIDHMKVTQVHWYMYIHSYIHKGISIYQMILIQLRTNTYLKIRFRISKCTIQHAFPLVGKVSNFITYLSKQVSSYSGSQFLFGTFMAFS